LLGVRKVKFQVGKTATGVQTVTPNPLNKAASQTDHRAKARDQFHHRTRNRCHHLQFPFSHCQGRSPFTHRDNPTILGSSEDAGDQPWFLSNHITFSNHLAIESFEMLVQLAWVDSELIDDIKHLEFFGNDSFSQHIAHFHFLPGAHQNSARLWKADLLVNWLTGSDNYFAHVYPPSSQSQLRRASARAISSTGKFSGLPRASITTPTFESITPTHPPSPGIPMPTSLSSSGAR